MLGALVGALIGTVWTLLGLGMGLRTYLDDNSSYNTWSYGYQVTGDGLPTLIGWAFVLLDLLNFIFAGTIGGLAARRVALPT